MNAFQWKWSRACCMQYTSAEGTDACTEGFYGLFHRSRVSVFQFPLSTGSVQDCERVADHTHRLHTMHTSALRAFLPFPSILPTEIQFQQFWWRCPINPRFCRMGFSISDLYKSYIGRTKIAFLQYLPSKCSHHLMKQTGFAISPWNKYNIKSVLHIYASYTTLVRNR